MDFQNYNPSNDPNNNPNKNQTYNEEQQFAGFEQSGMGYDPFYARAMMPPIILNDGKKESTTAMVLGIIGAVLSFWAWSVLFSLIPGFVCSLLGIIYGVKGKRLSRAATGNVFGQATAGLVLGIIGVVLSAIMVFLFVFVIILLIAFAAPLM